MTRIIRKPRALAARFLPRLALAAIAAGALLFTARAADAALTTGACLAQKRTAWGNLRKCQATAGAKVLKGKPADLAKCQTKFQEKLAKVTAKATKVVIACRYGDNSDGTVTDYDTGLQWETKDAVCLIFPNVVSHCVNFSCTWVEAQSFVDSLNGSSTDGLILTNAFAGYADWRLPTIVELETILLAPHPCGTSPCIDPTFGPTSAYVYWSTTTDATSPDLAWVVSFGNGGVGGGLKDHNFPVRAVRGGL